MPLAGKNSLSTLRFRFPKHKRTPHTPLGAPPKSSASTTVAKSFQFKLLQRGSPVEHGHASSVRGIASASMSCLPEQLSCCEALQHHFTQPETAETFWNCLDCVCQQLKSKGFSFTQSRMVFFFSSPGVIITNVVNPAQAVLGDSYNSFRQGSLASHL